MNICYEHFLKKSLTLSYPGKLLWMFCFSSTVTCNFIVCERLRRSRGRQATQTAWGESWETWAGLRGRNASSPVELRRSVTSQAPEPWGAYVYDAWLSLLPLECWHRCHGWWRVAKIHKMLRSLWRGLSGPPFPVQTEAAEWAWWS